MKKQGFTLMELILVAAILAIIIGLAILFIDNPLKRGDANKIKIEVSQVEAIIEQYKALDINSTEIATKIAKENFTFEAKAVGSLPYLTAMRKKETVAADFCSNIGNSEGTAYKYLKNLNGGNSLAGIYTDTAATDGMSVLASADKKVLCKSNSSPDNNSFAIAVKVSDNIWACGGYADSKSNTVRYFTIAPNAGKTLNINCSTTGSNSFLTAEADIYNK